jgi:hypothetical protein
MRDEGVTRVVRKGEVLFPRTLMRDEVFTRMVRKGEVLFPRTLMRDEVFTRMVRKGGSILCGCYWAAQWADYLKTFTLKDPN